jgi:hypothetical protein
LDLNVDNIGDRGREDGRQLPPIDTREFYGIRIR